MFSTEGFFMACARLVHLSWFFVKWIFIEVGNLLIFCSYLDIRSSFIDLVLFVLDLHMWYTTEVVPMYVNCVVYELPLVPKGVSFVVCHSLWWFVLSCPCLSEYWYSRKLPCGQMVWLGHHLILTFFTSHKWSLSHLNVLLFLHICNQCATGIS